MSEFRLFNATMFLSAKYLRVGVICLILVPAGMLSQEQNPGLVLLSSAQTGINFTNRCNETPGRCIYQYDYFYNGGGVAIADFNNDQLPDIFFTGNDVPNRLYFNKGNFQFEDVSKRAKISNNKWYTGVTVTDINQDGWNDIYVCCSGPDFLLKSTANELYVNNQDGTFSEQAEAYGIANTGLSTQAVFFDMDGDGDEDLFVLNHGVRNMAAGDMEWLNKMKSLPRELFLRFSNAVYKNENGQFINITKETEIEDVGFGLGIAVSNFNRDASLDIYVCNDYFLPDRFYLHQSNNSKEYREDINEHFSHSSYYSMGADAADINNDGWIDLMVLDMTPADHYRNKMLMNGMNVNEFRYLHEKLGYLPQYMFNTLQLNNGFGVMSDIGQLAGVHQSDWSWAPLLADLDNDGLKDLYITNGYKRDIKNNDWRIALMEKMQEPTFNEEVYFNHLLKADVTPIANQVYRNTNGYQFVNTNKDWKTQDVSFSNGAAYADLDLDGDLDLVVNNLDAEAFIYRNDVTKSSRYLRVKLTEKNPDFSLSNASVTIFTSNGLQRNEWQFTRGFQSYSEPILHFGLGNNELVDSLVISWGNGLNKTVVKPEINRVHEFMYARETDVIATREQIDLFTSGVRFISEKNYPMGRPYFHEENKFNDFEKEVLLPHRMSGLGPALAIADIDLNGLDDVFVGCALGRFPALYRQLINGQFEQVESRDFSGVDGSGSDDRRAPQDSPLDLFSKKKNGEMIGAEFFYANKDSFPDLYIAFGSGGELTPGDSLLRDELYLNDGNGRFIMSENALPYATESNSVVEACDYDNDGDQDLFVGGRNVPGLYPLSPKSYLLKNNNGIFLYDENWKNNYTEIGMITAAKWLDWDRDGDLDLIAVGEWTAVQVFLNDGGRLEKADLPEMKKLTGWWSAIETGDFDEDGDEDILLGNLGWNNKFRPSEKKPLDVYANDFDRNGTLDIVLGKHYKDKVVPVRGRECSSAQMPFLSQRFPTFDSFASSTLENIYSAQQLDSAYHLQVTTFSSMYLRNDGEGKYTATDLPVECQIAPIVSFCVDDFDNDGHLDVVFGGNNVETEVETIPYDAGRGGFMKGKADGTFEVFTSIVETGLFLAGDVRHIQSFKAADTKSKGLMVARNNGYLSVVFGKKVE